MSGFPNKRVASEAAILKQRVHEHFQQLLLDGLSPNEAAVQALAVVKAASASSEGSETENAASASSPSGSEAATAIGAEVQQQLVFQQQAGFQSQRNGRRRKEEKYGPLCLALAGPFQSVCVVGEPRLGKKLLVLDIDHTIYDPSTYGGTRGATVNSYDESTAARCRPGLHDFLMEVYKEYDIMVWSASDMVRILTLLQQLGICGAHHSDYRLVAVLDIDSMSELASDASTATSAVSGAVSNSASSATTSREALAGQPVESADGAMIQSVTVPQGAIPGQQMEARSIVDGSPIICAVPPGLKPGDTFHVTIPGAVSSASHEHGVDQDEMLLALQLSLGQSPSEEGDGRSTAMVRARKRGRSVKALSLIWACSEFSQFYSEKNTVIIDDTIDVCSANPHNSIQCSRYFWADHATDRELYFLKEYLMKIVQCPALPESHIGWRDSV
eukprot:TRINITY_DN27430_c0_g1_i1.p1 TRINITY_DN27430_c0_g1~~TRINITY_DN27430_c0_g1_i1.p1  ORF type:complete len:467 (-),score=84.05 TRINITY_DN27430_c0_g1_i1:194-1525(-)